MHSHLNVMELDINEGICTCMCHSSGHCFGPCCEPCDKCGRNITGGYTISHAVACKVPEKLKERIENEREIFSMRDDEHDLMRDHYYWKYITQGAIEGNGEVMDACVKEIKKLNESKKSG